MAAREPAIQAARGELGQCDRLQRPTSGPRAKRTPCLESPGLLRRRANREAGSMLPRVLERGVGKPYGNHLEIHQTKAQYRESAVSVQYLQGGGTWGTSRFSASPLKC